MQAVKDEITQSKKCLYFKVSDSKSVSKVALKIRINTETSEISLINLNKNTILVNRQAVCNNESVSLHHLSLIQLSSEDLFFFLLPHETIEKKKRDIKERRKDLERIYT